MWDENGHLFIHGAHHDGSVTVELRQLSDEGVDAYEAVTDAWVDEPFEANGRTYDGSARSVTEAIRDLWDATEPPRSMERSNRDAADALSGRETHDELESDAR